MIQAQLSATPTAYTVQPGTKGYIQYTILNMATQQPVFTTSSRQVAIATAAAWNTSPGGPSESTRIIEPAL